MAAYYDASVILAIVLGEGDRDMLLGAWNAEHTRVSSLLIRPECFVSIRRIASWARDGSPDEPPLASVDDNLATVADYLEKVECKPLDATIADLVQSDRRLARCRTLDAIHAATALWFQPHMDEPLRICSLDFRLRALARDLAFPVLPKSVPGEQSTDQKRKS